MMKSESISPGIVRSINVSRESLYVPLVGKQRVRNWYKSTVD